MLPIVFEWHWEIGRLIFMGLFYLALGAIGLGVAFGLVKTFIDLRNPSSHPPENH